MELTIYTSNNAGQASNCYYPNQRIIQNKDEFKRQSSRSRLLILSRATAVTKTSSPLTTSVLTVITSPAITLRTG